MMRLVFLERELRRARLGHARRALRSIRRSIRHANTKLEG
jgi:hypothetical protein